MTGKNRRGSSTSSLAALLLMLAAGCSRAPYDSEKTEETVLDPGKLNGQAAFEEVRSFVAIGPRHSGTPGAASAAEYLAERLRAIGIDPLVDEFTDNTPSGPVTFRNVVGVIPGRSRDTIILGSHYDTKSGIGEAFCGANDSGSSTGLLLEIADQLRMAAPLPVEILVAFFDGEECLANYGAGDGLHGSRRLARTLVQNRRADRTRAVILMDMVGDRDLQVTVPRNSSPPLVATAFESARSLGVRNRFYLARESILDDHVPFIEAGIPAIDLIDFQFGSAPGKNDYWHTPEDTLDKLSPDSLQTVGRVVIEMLNRMMIEAQSLTRAPPAAIN